MKKYILMLLMTAGCLIAKGQNGVVDSLQKAYQKNRQDTTLVQLLNYKAIKTELQTHTDSGLLHTRQALALARRIKYKSGEVMAMANMSNFLYESGDLPGALKITFEVLPMAAEINDFSDLSKCYNSLGLTYTALGNLSEALVNYRKALKVTLEHHDYLHVIIEYNNICKVFLERNMPDSALVYNNKAYALLLKTNLTANMSFLIRNFGIIQYEKGNYKGAIDFFRKSALQKNTLNNHYLQGEDYRRMAEAYRKLNNTDSCKFCAQTAYQQALLEHNPGQVMQAALLLTAIFKSQNDYKQAFNYQQIMLEAKDSLFSQQKALQVQNLTFNEQQRQDAIRASAADYRNKVRLYALAGILLVVILIAFILLYSNNARKRANHLLHEQKEEIEAQRDNLEQAYSDLKQTQAQLVQREKMASLGELTAGIAHEIQNPLNFINNFSDVNREMLEELEQELDNGDIEGAKAIAADIKQNEQKINHHGQRADAIVKGMLQHSRASTGQKEPADINALADEYLRLAYHGLRAKDKAFNAELVTNFQSKLPKVNMIPQDIGRVLLNVINNSFYATQQKAKTIGDNYKPTVEISTSQQNGAIVIKVKDNGTGIPENVLEKIMQPFFTTKPTGEGTGLGLSLSYDIVVKGHGGSFDVNTKEGEFTEFAISLPV